ncbi:5'-methylthioadenosine/S-adenosylhomocysteine nucleosidase [Vibrio sp. 10N]|uniref:5'-methylthioadenosine/S-adenosylhomocysteine nucleosidase n=1 Tax=Vibrio sp. 10N TaxID=3058938 RepID=UPI0028134467|nr:5'-methylthioadenosine/adenosylhomocysteine nucleosidase [Vibrio sp. 10N]
MNHMGIICAIRREAQPLITQYGLKRTDVFPFPVFSGKVGGIDISLVICGLGKVVASMASQALIQKEGVDEIINVGICGAINDGLKVGDVVYSTRFVQHDFNIDAPNRHHAWVPSIDSHITETIKPSLFCKIQEHPATNFGIMCSGDSFVKNRTSKLTIASITSGISVDMESAAIAQVCCLLKCPFMSLRSVSDLAENVPNDFESNMDLAIEKVTSLFNEVVSSHRVFA